MRHLHEIYAEPKDVPLWNITNSSINNNKEVEIWGGGFLVALWWALSYGLQSVKKRAVRVVGKY